MAFIAGTVFGICVGAILGFITFAKLLNDGMKSLGLTLGITLAELDELERKEDENANRTN